MKAGRYVVARSANTGRPVCQHYCESPDQSLCGYDLTGASRTYTDGPLEAIFCQRCRKALGGAR